jgi:hypothetical protein
MMMMLGRLGARLATRGGASAVAVNERALMSMGRHATSGMARASAATRRQQIAFAHNSAKAPRADANDEAGDDLVREESRPMATHC